LSPVAPRLLSVDRLLLHGGVARIPDARTPRNKGQWRIKAIGGRGNRCFCRRELITLVTPLSQPGSAKTAASVCLYSVHREQERSLFTAALEQTSNVPTAIIRPRPTAGLWSPIPSIRSAITSLRRAACLLFDRCATAPETGRCSPFHAPIPPASSGVQRGGGGGDSPAPRPMAVVLPQSRSPVPPPAVLGVPLPTMLIVRRRHWGPVRSVIAPHPFAPPPAIQL